METLCVVADSDMLITPVFRLIFVSHYVTKHSHLLFAFGNSGMSRRLPDTNPRKLPRQERSKANYEAIRAEERRVRKACVSTWSTRWAPYHTKKKANNIKI